MTASLQVHSIPVMVHLHHIHVAKPAEGVLASTAGHGIAAAVTRDEAPTTGTWFGCVKDELEGASGRREIGACRAEFAYEGGAGCREIEDKLSRRAGGVAASVEGRFIVEMFGS